MNFAVAFFSAGQTTEAPASAETVTTEPVVYGEFSSQRVTDGAPYMAAVPNPYHCVSVSVVKDNCDMAKQDKGVTNKNKNKRIESAKHLQRANCSPSSPRVFLPL